MYCTFKLKHASHNRVFSFFFSSTQREELNPNSKNFGDNLIQMLNYSSYIRNFGNLQFCIRVVYMKTQDTLFLNYRF